MPDAAIAPGIHVVDVTGRIGVFMDSQEGVAYLRPPGGGIEWEAPLSDIRPATAADRLSLDVAEVNANSRRGL